MRNRKRKRKGTFMTTAKCVQCHSAAYQKVLDADMLFVCSFASVVESVVCRAVVPTVLASSLASLALVARGGSRPWMAQASPGMASADLRRLLTSLVESGSTQGIVRGRFRHFARDLCSVSVK